MNDVRTNQEYESIFHGLATDTAMVYDNMTERREAKSVFTVYTTIEQVVLEILSVYYINYVK